MNGYQASQEFQELLKKQDYRLAWELYAKPIIEQGEYEFVTHQRISSPEDKDAENLYSEIKDAGCCAFYDVLILADDPRLQRKQYRVGFNFGH